MSFSVFAEPLGEMPEGKREEAGRERGGSIWGCLRLSLLPAEPLVLRRGDRARSRAQPHAAGTPGTGGESCWYSLYMHPGSISAPPFTLLAWGDALWAVSPCYSLSWGRGGSEHRRATETFQMGTLNLTVEKHLGPSHLLAVAGRMLSACPRGSWQAPRDHASCFRRTNGSVGSVSDLGLGMGWGRPGVCPGPVSTWLHMMGLCKCPHAVGGSSRQVEISKYICKYYSSAGKR